MSVVAETRRLICVDDPGANIPEKFAEVINGELIVMTPPSFRHNRMASNFEFIFRDFCMTRPELEYGGDNDGFRLRRNPDSLLVPDASIYRRRPEGKGPYLEFCPELLVEIRSPSNSLKELVMKRSLYFEAGAEQFWLVEPEKKQIEFHFREDRRIVATGDVVVECEGIAAGLRVDLAEIFRY